MPARRRQRQQRGRRAIGCGQHRRRNVVRCGSKALPGAGGGRECGGAHTLRGRRLVVWEQQCTDVPRQRCCRRLKEMRHLQHTPFEVKGVASETTVLWNSGWELHRTQYSSLHAARGHQLPSLSDSDTASVTVLRCQQLQAACFRCIWSLEFRLDMCTFSRQKAQAVVGRSVRASGSTDQGCGFQACCSCGKRSCVVRTTTASTASSGVTPASSAASRTHFCQHCSARVVKCTCTRRGAAAPLPSATCLSRRDACSSAGAARSTAPSHDSMFMLWGLRG